MANKDGGINMNKGDKMIMVVKRDHLFQDDCFEGFKGYEEIDYSSRILKNFEYKKRKLAEKDSLYKQPIGYCLIVNPELKQAFAYQRSSEDSKYFEKRLQGKWSWGLGGHIGQSDAKEGNPIHSSMLRELKEEVEVEMKRKPKVLGYINDDRDEVGKVHFGILYLIETNSKIVKPKDLEINRGELMPIEKLERICSSPDFIVEEWSKMSLDPLKSYLRVA